MLLPQFNLAAVHAELRAPPAVLMIAGMAGPGSGCYQAGYPGRFPLRGITRWGWSRNGRGLMNWAGFRPNRRRKKR